MVVRVVSEPRATRVVLRGRQRVENEPNVVAANAARNGQNGKNLRVQLVPNAYPDG